MALIQAYQHRGITKDFTVYDGDGVVITPGENDELRVMIGREGHLGANNADAELVVTTEEATAGGSTFTKGGGADDTEHRLRLDAADLDFEPGMYTLFLDYFDNADGAEWKNIDRQVFNLERT